MWRMIISIAKSQQSSQRKSPKPTVAGLHVRLLANGDEGRAPNRDEGIAGFMGIAYGFPDASPEPPIAPPHARLYLCPLTYTEF